MIRTLALSALLSPTIAWAQEVPATLTHQGRLLDAAGGPINGPVQLDVRILDGSGVPVHSERVDAFLQQGFYSVVLGVTSPLSDAVFAGADRFVEVLVDGTPLAPRSPLTSLPFAHRADIARDAQGDITPNSVTVGATSIDASGAITVAGQSVVTAEGSLPMSGQSCPADQVVGGFDADGAVVCRSVAAVPSGLIAFFAGDCPAGFTEYTPLAGRAVVGLSPGGVVEGPVGTPLAPGGLREITAVPAHTHSVNPPAVTAANAGAHSHSIDPPATGSTASGGHFHDVDAPTTATTSAAAHTHSVDPPNTSSTSVSDHTHAVNPPNTNTNTTGNHTHRAYAPIGDVNNSGSQGYPNNDNHQSFRSSDRPRSRTIASAAVQTTGAHAHSVDIASFTSGGGGGHAHTVNIGAFTSGGGGAHGHTVDLPSFRSATTPDHSHSTDIGAFDSSTTGAHGHTVDIGAFDSASTGQSAVDVTMPYLQLRACRAR